MKAFLAATVAAAALACTPAFATAIGPAAGWKRPKPAPHGRSFFSPVSRAARRALSGDSAGYLHIHQSYQEFSGGTVPDSENGTLSGVQMRFSHQGAHWGNAIRLSYARGDVTYRGSIQNLKTGATTPSVQKSPSRQLDMNYTLSWGFSPVSHIAVIPGATIGARIWWRGKNQLPMYLEIYRQPYWAGDLAVQYTDGAFALGARAAMGQTFDVSMNSSLDPQTYNLGSGNWRRYSLYANYQVSRRFSLYANVSHFQVNYGISGTHDVNMGGQTVPLVEPSSRTEQNAFAIGAKLLF